MRTVLIYFLLILIAFKLFAPGGYLNRKSIDDVKVIHIQPLGKVKKSNLQTIKSSIETFYGIRCVIKPSVGIKEGLLIDDEGAYDAIKIMSKYDDEERVVFVTEKRISKKSLEEGVGLNGVARYWGDKMVVSTFHMRRFYGNSKSFRDDLTNTALHEVGHTFGLDHCNAKRCVMFTSDTYHAPVDARKLTLCNNCFTKVGMEKLPKVK